MKPIDYVLGQPWAMTQAAVDTMVSIVERVNQDPSAVETQLGRPLDNTETVTVTDGVAVIPVIGPIARYMNIFTRISGGTSIEILARDFRQAVENPKVRAIVLDIDSPGGTVNGTSEFAAQVFAARGTKPVVAYGANDVCSGAYWIASACSELVANDTAHIGSIGVVGGYPKKTAAGPYTEFVSSRARNKRPDISTEEGRAIVQAHMDGIEDVFVSSVAKYRGVSEEIVVSDFGQGDHMIASKAVSAGMADRIGSLDGLIGELSRGEWRPPSASRPSKSGTKPKEPAMSEPTTQPVAGDQGNAEIERLKGLLAQSEADSRATAQANSDLLTRSIETEAKAFATEMIAAQCKAVPAERETLINAMSLALRDDHDHPLTGRPTARQDSVRAIYEKRTSHTLTRERGASDPAGAARALASDPASDTTEPDDPAAAARAKQEREERRQRNYANAERHNPQPAR